MVEISKKFFLQGVNCLKYSFLALNAVVVIDKNIEEE